MYNVNSYLFLQNGFFSQNINNFLEQMLGTYLINKIKKKIK